MILPLFLRIDVPYWCLGHVVKTHDRTVGLHPKCHLLNIL